jgi:hypothetical protein
MLTADELLVLESLLARARHAAGADRATILESITVGDVVQLRPGADPHWETSLLLVCRIRADGAISGQILQPHRGGYRDAWWTYRPTSVARVGRSPFPEPAMAIKSWSYDPCPVCCQRRRKPPGRARRSK